jgi:hypothetical protein
LHAKGINEGIISSKIIQHDGAAESRLASVVKPDDVRTFSTYDADGQIVARNTILHPDCITSFQNDAVYKTTASNIKRYTPGSNKLLSLTQNWSTNYCLQFGKGSNKILANSIEARTQKVLKPLAVLLKTRNIFNIDINKLATYA